MVNVYRLILAVAYLIANVSVATSVSGQEIVLAENRQVKVYNPPSQQKSSSIPLAFRQDRTYGQLPAELELASREAFSSSMMPLDDYLVHLGYARDARLAEQNLTTRQITEIWQQYRDQIQAASDLLNAFNQPASRSWNAERVWAEYSVARANLEMARALGDRSATTVAQAGAAMAILQLSEQRQFDYSLGLASLDELAYAHDRLLREFAFPEEERNRVWTKSEIQKNAWNTAGAKIGSPETVLEMAIVRTTLTLQQSLQSIDIKLAAQQLSTVSQLSEQQFAVLAEHFKLGTAPVSDLTRSIAFRNRLSILEHCSIDLKGSFDHKQFAVDWQFLQRAAEQIPDMSGRNGADLLAIRLVGTGLQN